MNFKVCACMRICVCLDKVHDEFMHECVTVVMLLYAKQEIGREMEERLRMCVREGVACPCASI